MRQEIRREAAAAAVLLFLALLFWKRFFFDGLVFYARDLGFFFAPIRHALAEGLRQGAPPVWNPFLGGGVPMAADPNAAAFFPPVLLYLVRPFSAALRLSFAFWIFAFPLGAYAGLRAFKVSRWAAATAAGAIAISGPALSLTFYPSTAWAAAFLLPVSGATAAAARGVSRAGVVAGVLFGIGILAGEPAIACQILLAAVVIAFSAGLRRGLRIGGLVAGVGFLIAAPQVIGAMELLPQTARSGGLPVQYGAAFSSVRPLRILAFLWPGLFGDVSSPSAGGFWGRAFFDAGAPYVASLAVGTVTVALLAVAWRSRNGRRLAGLALVGAVLSFGRYLPGGTALLGLPGFSLLRYPEKWLVSAALFALAAVAVALDRLTNGDDGSRRAAVIGSAVLAVLSLLAGAAVRIFPEAAGRSLLRWRIVAPEYRPNLGDILSSISGDMFQVGLFALACLMLIHFLARRGQTRRIGFALALLLLLDLFPRTWNSVPLAPASFYDSVPPAAAAVAAAPGRLYFGQEAEMALDPLRPMTPVVWGIPFVANNDIDRFSPRRSFFYGLEVSRLSFSDVRETRLLQLADVSRVSTTDPFAAAAPSLARLFTTSPRRAVFALAGGGRFRTVFRTSPARDESQARAILLSGGFDPEREAVVEGPASPRLDGDGRGSVAAIGRRADAETVEVEVTSPAVLVRSETYEPRWRATLDGQEAPLFPADYAFQGVLVPAGRHRVAFRYVDRAMMLGMCISLATLAACVRALATRN